MVRGLYTAASGALVAQSMADNVASNLANVSSSGFKQTLLQIQSAPTMDVYRIQTDPGQTPHRAVPGVSVTQLVGSLGSGSQVYDTPEDFSQGPLQQTGNRLDVALVGANGFFNVLTPQGVRYTRDGQFTVDANGTLTTQDGNFVLGTDGRPLHFNVQQGIPTIGADGTITQAAQAGQTGAAQTQIGQIAITSFGNLTALRKEGDNTLVDTGGAQPYAANTQAGAANAVSVEQGSIEKSNFNIVRSMVDLITAERWFDANERVMKAQDDAVNQDITNVVRPTS